MMGKPFLKKYYKIVLNDPNEVVICAENEKGQIVGFNSSTLDAKAQMDNLRRKGFNWLSLHLLLSLQIRN